MTLVASRVYLRRFPTRGLLDATHHSSRSNTYMPKPRRRTITATSTMRSDDERCGAGGIASGDSCGGGGSDVGACIGIDTGGRGAAMFALPAAIGCRCANETGGCDDRDGRRPSWGTTVVTPVSETSCDEPGVPLAYGELPRATGIEPLASLFSGGAVSIG